MVRYNIWELQMNYISLIETLEHAWGALQVEYPDIPDCLITVGTGGRRAPNLYGHFAPNCWTMDDEDIHEVLIVAEQLRRSPEDIFTTLMHESVHGIANKRGIKDVSGRRHNKKFRDLCLEVGMLPPEFTDAKLGFSAVTLSPALREKFNDSITDIGVELTLCRKLKLKDKDTPKTSWSAECECPRKIRVGKKALLMEGFDITLDEIPDGKVTTIDCGLCGTAFKVNND